MEKSDVDSLFSPLNEEGQDRVVELAKLCKGNQRFEVFTASAAGQCLAYDPKGLCMVILASMQMALDWRDSLDRSVRP